MSNAVIFNHEGISEYSNLNLVEEDRSLVKAMKKKTESFFGITCCGASISPNLNYSLIGDFLGNVHMFHNKEQGKDEGSPITHVESIFF